MEAYKLYKVIFFEYIGFYSDLAGVNLSLPNYRPTAYTYGWIALNTTMLVSGVYSMIMAGWEMAWKNLTIFGVIVQGLVKFIVLLSYSSRITEKVQFLGVVYKQNSYANTRNAAVLQKWAERGLLFVQYGVVIFVAPLFIFIAYPMFVYFQSGELELILPILLPGVDPQSTVGFVFLSVLHVGACLLAAFGTCGADFMLVVLVVHMWPLCDVFDNMVGEMNAHLAVESNRNTAEMRRFFRNIILLHTEICEYLEDISQVYFFMTFCEVYTCAESMSAVLYCFMFMTWIPLYFLFVTMFVILLSYCVLGTVAEMATDRIYMTLMDSDWYLLPPPLQRHMVMMLARAQNPTILMAGTLPLNLDTFVAVIKAVYSIGMLLVGTVE